ncbi:MAG: VapC toxin family PIN domain ribonuclease [Polyangiaceae bacterium]|nr:VapC toxin family PIN domain ribonuclease [Polyangiaceae bacterium]
MSRCVVLDAEALAALGSSASRRQREVQAALAAAARLGREVIVPALVLAELYRGRPRASMVDACLSRETGLYVRVTDRAFARLVGSVLAAAAAGSEHIVDAHAVAAAVEAGGGIVLTCDPTDLGRLAAPYRNVQIVDIG